MAVKAKELRYAVEVSGGEARTEDGTPLATEAAWTPEHLLLASLVRCSIASLEYSAGRAGVEVTSASGSAKCVVTRRESDGRYAVVRTDVTVDVALDPKPGRAALAELFAKAERGCFIGASLSAKPTYRWNVA